MRKILAFLISLVMLLSLSFLSLAEGVTLKTVSTFAGTDAAAETYVALLKAWEEKTGNKIEDASSTGDEVFKAGVLNDFAAGNEADLLFFFAKTADSAPILEKVVPIEEINAAYPELNLPVNTAIAEPDGVVYSIPVRPFWEGLFCNIDLFEQVGAQLPTTWENLVDAIARFKEAGIVPIAVSFSDIPHYIADVTVLSASSEADYLARPKAGDPIPQAWIDGNAKIHELYELGAFPVDVNATTEAVTSQMFRDKKAAMQMDGSWFANGIPEENYDTTMVVPFPVTSEEAQPTAFMGGVSMGFYVSRKAWDDPAKRDAVVDLLAYLTTGDNAVALAAFQFKGKLLESSFEMLNAGLTTMYGPLQDAMDPEARSYWFSQIPGIADGTADPADVWKGVMELAPFGK